MECASVDATSTLAVRSRPERPSEPSSWWLPPAIAAAAAVLGWAMGWRGVDLPAQIYRVTLFHHAGLTVWDSQWYGGHWTLDYSVIFTPVAGWLGLNLAGLLSAAGAALAFDRLVVGHFGKTGRVGSLLFAIGTVVQLAIGQLPFLMGEALALGACWAAARQKWPLAIALAVATSLASPLAGAFLVLAMVAWLLAGWPDHRVGLTLVTAGVTLPLLVTAALFPGQGNFPYPLGDFAFEATAAVILFLLVPRGERALRVGAGLYVIAIVGSFLIPTPLGGNVGRLGECLAIPLGACVLWSSRRMLLVALAIPIALWQWTPALGAMTADRSHPSTHQSYFQPLIAFLQQHDDPPGRVEVVPTRYHWEAAFVAPTIPLARGWERQLDTADNPLFYDTDRLNGESYQTWLLGNGVRYVALPDAPLDFSGTAEARLVSKGLPGLVPVWRTEHWRVFAVTGSSGIVDGPAHLVRLDGGRVTLDATGPGPVLLRVRYSPDWTVTGGTACLSGTPDRWTVLDVPGPEEVRLELRLTVAPWGGHRSACP
jgi:hypothetical protein